MLYGALALLVCSATVLARRGKAHAPLVLVSGGEVELVLCCGYGCGMGLELFFFFLVELLCSMNDAVA